MAFFLPEYYQLMMTTISSTTPPLSHHIQSDNRIIWDSPKRLYTSSTNLDIA